MAIYYFEPLLPCLFYIFSLLSRGNILLNEFTAILSFPMCQCAPVPPVLANISGVVSSNIPNLLSLIHFKVLGEFLK